MDDHADSEPEQQPEEGTKRTIRRWTQDEHNKLVALVARQQESGQTEICWAAIARELPGRTGKQCRHRWVNSCQPFTKRGVWDLDEEHIVAQLHASHGSAWSHIASKLKGRSENSVKNHYNALFRSKYLDSKKESVLANYVKLLREGHAQCVETYEQALEITRMFREQAISRISGGPRLTAARQQATLSQDASEEVDVANITVATATANGAGSSHYGAGTASATPRASRGVAMDGTPASMATRMRRNSSVTTGKELAQALQATSGTDFLQRSANNLVAELTAADGFDWQAALQSFEPEGAIDHAARALGQDMVGRTTPAIQLSGPSNWQSSQHLQASMGDANSMGDASSAQHQAPSRSFSLLGRTAMFTQMNGLTLQADSLDLDLNHLLEQQPALETPQLLLGMAPGGDSGVAALGRQSCPGLNSHESGMDLMAEVGGSSASQQGPSDAYSKWISYSGGSSTPMMKARDAKDRIRTLQELVTHQAQQLQQLTAGRGVGNMVTTNSPLLQSMLTSKRDAQEGQEVVMGGVKEEAVMEKHGRLAQAIGSSDAVQRVRPSRRRSYAELYADSPTQQQLEAALAPRSQPGSSLGTDPTRGLFGPNSAHAVNDVDQIRTDPTNTSFTQANAAAAAGRPPQPVAWGGTRDAVFLPPGWAPKPDLNGDLDIDDILYAAPRAPRARRTLEIAASQLADNNKSAGPSPPSTTGLDIPPAPPSSAANVSGSHAAAAAADLDGPSVSQAQRRRHSVSYMPIAEAGAFAPAEVDMTDLAAYVPGQNRRRSMSVLSSGGVLALAPAPGSGNLPAPMHMGVSDAPGRKQRFRRRSVEAYSAGNLSANGVLDPSLVSLLTQHDQSSEQQASHLQGTPSDMMMDLSEQFGMGVDNPSGLTPMVSGIDLSAHSGTAGGANRLHATASSGLAEPTSAVNRPPTMAGGNSSTNNPFPVLDSCWDQLQDALSNLNPEQPLSRGASSNMPPAAGQQQQQQQLYVGQEMIQLPCEFLQQPVQGQQELDTPRSSSHLRPTDQSVSTSTYGMAGHQHLTGAANGMLQQTPAASPPLSGSMPASSATALGEFASSLMANGAESILGGVIHSNGDVTADDIKPSLPLLDTTMSVSFNQNQLSPTTDMLLSPALNSIFRSTGTAVDASDADAVLCPLRPPLGRDDNSFKERLNIGQPLASLDALLRDGGTDAI